MPDHRDGGERWYARRNPDNRGLWCVMDVDEPPTVDHPPIIDAVPQSVAQHVTELHNAWTGREGRVRTAHELAAMAPVRVHCPVCGNEYNALRSGRMRVHTVDQHWDSPQCDGSRMPVDAPDDGFTPYVVASTTWTVRAVTAPDVPARLVFTDRRGVARAVIELRGGDVADGIVTAMAQLITVACHGE